MERISIKTSRKNEFVNITRLVQKTVEKTKVNDGFCVIFCPHTTGGITVNEAYDSAVKDDLVFSLDKISPDYPAFKHMEGNSDAHVKSSIVGCSQNFIVENGQILLGQWQGIYFAEFDGPRNREIWVKFVGK